MGRLWLLYPYSNSIKILDVLLMVKLFVIVNVDWFFLSHRKDIALSAQKNGYDVTVVTKDTGKKSEIEALGLKVIDLPMNRSGQNIIEELYTCWFLYRLYYH